MRYREEGQELTWAQLEEAVRLSGSEKLIAKRLRELRNRAGLSQVELAERLAKLGAPIPQPSISKIEASAEAGKTGRDITVTEALALAKALDVTFAELLLPDNAVKDMRLYKLLGEEGPELYRAYRKAESQYKRLAWEIADAAKKDPRWRAVIADQRKELREGVEKMRAVVESKDQPKQLRNGLRPMLIDREYFLEFLDDVAKSVESVE